MKIAKVLIGSLVLLQSVSLYAESSKQCLKYWNEPVVEISIISDVTCPDVWEEEFSKNNRIVIEKLGLDRTDDNWISTGLCKKVKHKGNIYFAYRAFLKNDKTNLIMLYDNKKTFAYLRRLDLSKFKNGYTDQDIVDVNLTCNKLGEDLNISSILNSYILKDTSIKNISKYQISDWY